MLSLAGAPAGADSGAGTWRRQRGGAGGGVCARAGSSPALGHPRQDGRERRDRAGELAGKTGLGLAAGAQSPAARRARAGAASRGPGTALRAPLTAAACGPFSSGLQSLRAPRSGPPWPARGRERGERGHGHEGGRPGTGALEEARGAAPRPRAFSWAVSSSPPKLELGAVRAVKGPEHLKEQCTWGSKARGRGHLFSPG